MLFSFTCYLWGCSSLPSRRLHEGVYHFMEVVMCATGYHTVFLNLPSVSVMQAARDDNLVSLCLMCIEDRADHILGIPGYAIIKDSAALTCTLACLEHLPNVWVSNRQCHCSRVIASKVISHSLGRHPVVRFTWVSKHSCLPVQQKLHCVKKMLVSFGIL